MNTQRLFNVFLLLFIAFQCYAQSLTITQGFDVIPNGQALTAYKEQFGHKEKPDLDDTFPYVVIRIGLEGSSHEIAAAKQMLTLYLGTQTMVEAIYRDVPNELIFLIPSRARHVEITCGEGCARQTIMDMASLKSNSIYYGRVHYIPMEGFQSGSTITKRQLFTFHVTPADASLRVFVDGTWQHWPVKNGIAAKSLEYGMYRYEVSAEDYKQEVGTITVSEKSKQLTTVLRPNFGWITLKVTEESQGAYVYVTNKETSITRQLGQLPLDKEKMACGSYQIEVQKEQYKGYSTTVTITEGKNVTLTPKLQPNYAHVNLSASDGVDIYLDGQYLGTTKWEGNLEYGDYTFETRKNHFRSVYTPIIISELDVTHTFQLNAPIPAFGALVIDGSPSGASVFVDDDLVGETPLIINQISIGEHNVHIKKNGYKTNTQIIDIEENAEEVLMYTLELGDDKSEAVASTDILPIVDTISIEGNNLDTVLGITTDKEKIETKQLLPGENTIEPEQQEPLFGYVTPQLKKTIFNTLIVGEFGYSVAPQLSYGGMLGQMYNGIGWFVKGRSNFNFQSATHGRTCDKSGRLNGSNSIPLYSGRSSTKSWIADVGIIMDFLSGLRHEKRFKNNCFGMYLGGGYGVREVLWETKAGNWVTYQPNSYEGFSIDGGVFGSIYCFTITAGVNTIGFKYMEIEVGVGVTF